MQEAVERCCETHCLMHFCCRRLWSWSARRRRRPPAGQAGRGGAPASPPMVLSTTAFPDGGVIPNRHTQVQQAERGISPALSWANAPAATQSFVVHMRDPEVARNRTTDDQVHWLVWNIPGTEKGLPEGMPEGAQLPNGIRQISASGAVYRGPGAPASRPDASLHVRGICPRHEDRHAARRRRVGNASQSLQGDGWSCHRQSRDGRIVQASAVETMVHEGPDPSSRSSNLRGSSCMIFVRRQFATTSGLLPL